MRRVIANSADGDAPDESTIRRRIQAVWKGLNPKQSRRDTVLARPE